jgi:hypothetical protein
MIVIASYRALRHGRYPAFPGTSCQATFTPSLRDKPLLAKTRNRRQRDRLPVVERIQYGVHPSCRMFAETLCGLSLRLTPFILHGHGQSL